MLWTSPDGSEWSQLPHDPAAFGAPADLMSIAANEYGYVVGGSFETETGAYGPAVWTSTDGVTWTRVALEKPGEVCGVLGVALTADVLVAVGVVDDAAAVWRAALSR